VYEEALVCMQPRLCIVLDNGDIVCRAATSVTSTHSEDAFDDDDDDDDDDFFNDATNARRSSKSNVGLCG